MDAITVASAAIQLGTSRQTVLRWLESGQLAGSRATGVWLVARESIASFKDSQLRDLRVDEAFADALEAVVVKAFRFGFRRYFNEDDVMADLAAELWNRVPADEVEVRLELATAGFSERARPDLSVIPALSGMVDRRKALPFISVEGKYFSYKRPPVRGIEVQFDRLVTRIKAGRLGSGAFVWFDAFDWRELFEGASREVVIQDRIAWVQSRFTAPESRVRFDYVPLLYPQHRTTLLNGLPSAAPVRKAGGLCGAAVPFITRRPAAGDDWDELVAQAVAEDWLLSEAS